MVRPRLRILLVVLLVCVWAGGIALLSSMGVENWGPLAAGVGILFIFVVAWFLLPQR
jgi:hypothetical protein